jgi:1-acyl-sn-glycerol-3-phosphate acyltransferase
MMALRARVPIYPAYLGGIQRNMSIPRGLVDAQSARASFGVPITADGEIGELTERLQAAVERLRNRSLAATPP